MKSKVFLRKLTLTAIFAALAVVIKAFTNLALNIPGVGVKIGFSGIFTFFPAILCGPVWGGVASALSDVLGYLVAPDGAYIPWLTLTAFCGGLIKGFLWMALTKKAEKPVKLTLISLFALIGIFGAAVNISLNSDGVMNTVIAYQKELPYRGQTDSMELSPLSKFAVDTAYYNKDTFTLKTADGQDLVLPQKYDLYGLTTNITKIDKNAFKNCSGAVYIPATYKTIPDDTDPGGITLIYGAENSAAQKFAENSNIPFKTYDENTEFPVLNENTDNFTVSSSDTYRKYLASNINLLVFGIELTGIIGILFILINSLIRRFSKKTVVEKRAFGVVKIAVCAVTAGVIVTTINTFILSAVLEAWQGRSILILLIPRVAEEIIVCMIQAYIISLLYGALYRGPLKKQIDLISPEREKKEENV